MPAVSASPVTGCWGAAGVGGRAGPAGSGAAAPSGPGSGACGGPAGSDGRAVRQTEGAPGSCWVLDHRETEGSFLANDVSFPF